MLQFLVPLGKDDKSNLPLKCSVGEGGGGGEMTPLHS